MSEDFPAHSDREVRQVLLVCKVTQDSKDRLVNQDQGEKPDQQAYQVYQANKVLLGC